MKQKDELQADLLEDKPDATPVQTIVINNTIWTDMTEVRCICKDNKIYAALYQCDVKATEFAETIREERKG